MADDRTISARGGGQVPCLSCAARASLLCSGMRDADLPALYAHARPIRLKRGQPLIMEGDQAERVYNVRAGHMMLSRLVEDGRRQVLAFIGIGDYVGHTVAPTYSFSAEALSDVLLCGFERSGLETLIGQYPGFERQFRRMTTVILEDSLDLIVALGRKNALERLCSFLLLMANRERRRGGGADIAPLPMTRADIADFLGLTLETVSRTFSRLKRAGLIVTEGADRVRLVDPVRMAAIAEGGQALTGPVADPL